MDRDRLRERRPAGDAVEQERHGADVRPPSVPGATPYVSLNVKVVPLTAVWLAGESDALTGS